MASRFDLTSTEQRHVARLLGRACIDFGFTKNAPQCLQSMLGRYETTTWPRERSRPTSSHPGNSPAHAILRIMGRAPGATVIGEFLGEYEAEQRALRDDAPPEIHAVAQVGVLQDLRAGGGFAIQARVALRSAGWTDDKIKQLR